MQLPSRAASGICLLLSMVACDSGSSGTPNVDAGMDASLPQGWDAAVDGASEEPDEDAGVDAASNEPDEDAGRDAASDEPDAATISYLIEGTLGGWKPTQLVLATDSEELVLNDVGPFEFTTPLPVGTPYRVVVKGQPEGAFCTVSYGEGVISAKATPFVWVLCTLEPCRMVGFGNVYWCKTSQPSQSCDQVCTQLGRGAPAIADDSWSSAQDTLNECRQIAGALNIRHAELGSSASACVEITADDTLTCSTNPACSTAQRSTQASGDALAVCPCMTDQDYDSIPDSLDNCPTFWNPWQEDADKDGVGDACDEVVP